MKHPQGAWTTCSDNHGICKKEALEGWVEAMEHLPLGLSRQDTPAARPPHGEIVAKLRYFVKPPEPNLKKLSHLVIDTHFAVLRLDQAL